MDGQLDILLMKPNQHQEMDVDDHFSLIFLDVFFGPPSNFQRQDCILGSMAFVALFFSVDGSAVAARSPEECPVQQGTIWWYTFVALCPGDGDLKG